MKGLAAKEILHRVPLPGCVEFGPGDRVRIHSTVRLEDAEDLPGESSGGSVSSSSLGWVSGHPCLVDGVWHVKVVCEGLVPVSRLEKL